MDDRNRQNATKVEIEAQLEAELTRYLEWALIESTPPRLVELARELQRKLREQEE